MSLSTQLTSGSLAANGVIYLVIAACCLAIAARLLKNLLVPIGPLVRAVTAMVVVIFCLGAALVLLTAALVGGR